MPWGQRSLPTGIARLDSDCFQGAEPTRAGRLYRRFASHYVEDNICTRVAGICSCGLEAWPQPDQEHPSPEGDVHPTETDARLKALNETRVATRSDCFHLCDRLRAALRTTNLELHGRVLLILWCCVALVVEVVGGGGVDDGRLLRRLVDSLTVDVDQEGEQAGAQEAGNARGNQVDGGERWRGKGDGRLLPPEF